MVTKVASKHSIKPEYGAVAFYGNRTVATDTFRLLEISAQGEAHEPRLLPAKAVGQLVKLSKEQLVSLERIAEIVGQSVNTKHQYPDVDQVINSAEAYEDYVDIHLNGRLLAEVLLALSKLNKFEGVKLRVPKEPERPILAYSWEKNNEKEGHQKGRGLVMPFNR